MNKKILLLGGVIAVALVVAGIGYSMATKTTNSQMGIQVVAGVKIWGDIATQIAGPLVRVTSLISDPNADPHLYESTAQDSLAVANADLVIVNGLGYDDFLEKLLNASQSAERRVVTAATAMDVTGNANPHVWYDIEGVIKVARAITLALKDKDPSNAATYDANLNVFIESLGPIRTTITNLKTAYQGASIAYTEPVPAYLVHALGLTDKTPQGFAQAMENGTEPTAGDQLAMADLLKNHRVRLLIYNTQAESQVTQNIRDIANQAKIPVVAMSETMPANTTFQDWQQYQLILLQGALAGDR